MKQTCDTVLMIRPETFRLNEQTLVDNYYQKPLASPNLIPNAINKKAQEEFDTLVDKLKESGINVIVVQEENSTDTPDAIFPNNWISFHENANVALYPMFAENRRLERREDILDIIESEGFKIQDIVDYTIAEEEQFFLEGTGSMVLDRANRKAYCAISQRSDEDLFIEFCEDFEYTPVVFLAYQTVDGLRKPIYHTNVMMSIGESFAIVCLNTIDDKKERKAVISHLKQDNKEVIVITEQQVSEFAGNILQLRGVNDSLFIVMSQSAFDVLSQEQKVKLEKHGTLIKSDIKTIETCGGGSVRCMMAEVFLPKL